MQTAGSGSDSPSTAIFATLPVTASGHPGNLGQNKGGSKGDAYALDDGARFTSDRDCAYFAGRFAHNCLLSHVASLQDGLGNVGWKRT